MKKIIFYLVIGFIVSSWAITEQEKTCIEEKRKRLNEKIEDCRKRFSDAKEVSVCAQDAKAQFLQEIKTCYEKRG